LFNFCLQALLILILLCGCSSHRPWTNSGPKEPSKPYIVGSGPDRSIVAAVTLSGGGTRAAAFGLGVLATLKDTAIYWDGRHTTLLDEVSLISGVSGGSVLAAHYAAFGDLTLKNFERDFLNVDFESRIIGRASTPEGMYKLGSPWFGRTHLLAEELDRLYEGRRFGDAALRHGAPELLVTATDLSHGAPFEFSHDQLAAMCIDWREIPLSFAVAASAAVPLILSPVTLNNYTGQCHSSDKAEISTSSDFRTQLRSATAATYFDATRRPFIHLVDGGLSDNLGVRSLLDRFVASGSIADSFPDAPEGSIRRLILIVVNAERDASETIELDSRVPTTGQVLDTLVFGAGGRDTKVTLAILQQDVVRWTEELTLARGRPGSPFSADAQIHALVVSLRVVPDPERREALTRMPTSLSLSPGQVRELQAAARSILLSSPAFRRLVASFQE